jgi:hypothetical protein
VCAAAVVTDGDQHLVVIDFGLAGASRDVGGGVVGVVYGIGQGFVDGQGEVINRSWGHASDPLRELDVRCALTVERLIIITTTATVFSAVRVS